MGRLISEFITSRSRLAVCTEIWMVIQHSHNENNGHIGACLRRKRLECSTSSSHLVAAKKSRKKEHNTQQQICAWAWADLCITNYNFYAAYVGNNYVPFGKSCWISFLYVSFYLSHTSEDMSSELSVAFAVVCSTAFLYDFFSMPCVVLTIEPSILLLIASTTNAHFVSCVVFFLQPHVNSSISSEHTNFNVGQKRRKEQQQRVRE